MTFDKWIEGFEERMNNKYTERELDLMRWVFDVGGMKAQPIGTYVEFNALIPDCIYENMEFGYIIKVGRKGELLTPTKTGLQEINGAMLAELPNCTYMRVK